MPQCKQATKRLSWNIFINVGSCWQQCFTVKPQLGRCDIIAHALSVYFLTVWLCMPADMSLSIQTPSASYLSDEYIFWCLLTAGCLSLCIRVYLSSIYCVANCSDSTDALKGHLPFCLNRKVNLDFNPDDSPNYVRKLCLFAINVYRTKMNDAVV